MKALGQHFLTDMSVVARIVTAFDPTTVRAVIEVGPGRGVLTDPLSVRAPKLIAVEKDLRLTAALREHFADVSHVHIVGSDILEADPGMLLNEAGLSERTTYGVVGNLPYNVGAAVLRHFLEAPQPPLWMVVMLQREVAAGISAEAGDLGILGVAIQVYAEVRHLFNVPATAFFPPPKVVSSVIRLDIRDEPLVPVGERDWFFTVVKSGFSAPRKQLRNSLAQGLLREVPDVVQALESVDIDSTRRPQTLDVDDWLRLSRVLIRPGG